MMRTTVVILLSFAAMPAFAQEKPMMITSDTVEYCDQLQLRVGKAGTGSAEIQRLVAEGRAMCDHGEIRGGIVRLRRALVLLRKHALQPHA
jgi:hypothetical protein